MSVEVHDLNHSRVTALDRALTVRAYVDQNTQECHEYRIFHGERPMAEANSVEIRFQKGPIRETGNNGISAESVIAVLVDHLSRFQSGDLKNRETAVAITKLEEAAMWLKKRSEDRARRGVEGTSEK